MDGRIKNSWLTTHWFGSKRFSWEKYKFYELYLWMIARCTNKNHKWYKNYWWRWIKCLWKSFEEFRDDMYESYLTHIKEYWKRQTTLDRIDNDWNYCKDNCKWATRFEQVRNTRVAKIAEVDGKKYSSRDVSEMCWIWIDAARNRIKKYLKWESTVEKLLFIWNRKHLNGSKNL